VLIDADLTPIYLEEVVSFDIRLIGPAIAQKREPPTPIDTESETKRQKVFIMLKFRI